MKINGVAIGDKFKKGNITNEVVDFYELKSLKTGAIIGYNCMAKGVDTISGNVFEVPFATVIRFKI
jgi:hypothetical protein